MNEYQLVAILPNLLCIILCAHMAFNVRGNTPSKHRPWLLLSLFLMAGLALIWLIERFTSDFEIYMSRVVLEYAFSAYTLIAILCFSLIYVGHEKLVNVRSLLLLAALGAACVAMNATNGLHHQFYRSVEIVESFGLNIMQPEYGPLFLLWLMYCLGLLSLTIILLIKAAWGTTGEKRTGILLISIGVGFYTAMGVIFALIERDPRLDLLSIGLVVASILAYEADRHGNVLDHYRITIHEAIRAMDDAVVIMGPDDRVVYMNDVANGLLLGDCLQRISEVPAEGSADVMIHTPAGEREFNVRRSSIDRQGRTVGNVTVLRDVTERKSIERQLSMANSRLDTVGRILRHDLVNELAVLSGNIELLEGMGLDELQSERLEKIRKAGARLNQMVERVRDQQIAHPVLPEWQDLVSAIAEGTRNMDLDEVELTISTSGHQILADPMLPLVFNNLMDNSLRHGGDVSKVSARVEKMDEGIRVIWEDDGQGVPLAEKKEIFTRGYGRHTGLGLFFVREILNMTGLTIIEDGQPGKGARFVITVPGISCRMAL